MRSGAVLLLFVCAVAHGASNLTEVAAGFRDPPDDARVMMRWWWFGSAVSRPELQREIRAMKAGGFGGFELQPVYPLSLDDSASGVRNLTFLSDEFINAVRFAADQARAEKLRVDLTLGSGWPYGGSYVPVTQASSQIAMIKTAIPAGTQSVPVPPLNAGEKLLAVFIGHGSPDAIETNSLRMLSMPSGPRLVVGAFDLRGVRDSVDSADSLDIREARRSREARGSRDRLISDGMRTALFFVQTRTGQQVKRPGPGGEGFVLDHLNRAAVDAHLNVVGERLLLAFPKQPPYAVFSDSLEVYRADWTDDFPEEFARRRGYDLLPLLPALFLDVNAQSADIRHDWGRTLAELIDERYLKPVNEWARKKGIRFRAQTYGFPPVTLSSSALVALPEGEGTHWRGFSTTRWASSASHLYGQSVTSVEAWTWLHSPAFRATPLDMKAEADVLFLQGANQLIGHGWPYTPPSVPAPGWSFYAAGVFSDQNPWWIAMPDIARYLQRVSYLLRQGEPVNDVAIFLPTDDALAATTSGRATVSDNMPRHITEEITAQLLNGGYGFDYIDAAAIDKAGLRYRALVLPDVTRIAPDTYHRIEQYAQHGGIVMTVGEPPSLGAGYLQADTQRTEVQAISRRLFSEVAQSTRRVAQTSQLGEALRKQLEPDVRLNPNSQTLGFVHRRLDDADLYFLVNTSAQPLKVNARFRDAHGRAAQWWNPAQGTRTAAMVAAASGYRLELAPYESRVIAFANRPATDFPHLEPGASRPTASNKLIADLSQRWGVSFEPLKVTQRMMTLRSWTDDEATRYYSGVAVYTRDFTVPPAMLPGNGQRAVLSFGEGTPVPVDPKQHGGRAWLDSPVREAAAVIVNGKRAGSIWAPPYELDVTEGLHAGTNHIELRVGNLAINTLAGRAPADYRLLTARYGQRFAPQDMDHLQPVPSGILGHIQLQLAPAL